MDNLCKDLTDRIASMAIAEQDALLALLDDEGDVIVTFHRNMGHPKWFVTATLYNCDRRDLTKFLFRSESSVRMFLRSLLQDLAMIGDDMYFISYKQCEAALPIDQWLPKSGENPFLRFSKNGFVNFHKFISIDEGCLKKRADIVEQDMMEHIKHLVAEL